MSATEETMVHVRINTELKKEASTALKAMGMNMSEFIRVALTRVAHEKAIPFEIKVPNTITLEAMNEARAMATKKQARFNDTKELLNDLEKNGKK